MQLSHDRFLDGRLRIWQPKKGYRAGVDPVFLAASVPAKNGQSVLELGCGVGVASLCLGWRVKGLNLTGLELQGQYAELAQRNASENGIGLDVSVGDLTEMPAAISARSFDHVIANPPYFDRTLGTGSDDAGRDLSLAGETPLTDWIDAGTKRLMPGGYFSIIQKSNRLPDVLRAMDQRLGEVVVKPLAPRQGRNAELVVIRARKASKTAFRLAAPLVLHAGEKHLTDAEDYSDIARNILRNGAALESF